MAQAQVVIENGAGYDSWMGSLLSADGGQPDIVNAAQCSTSAGAIPTPTSGTTFLGPEGRGGHRRDA